MAKSQEFSKIYYIMMGLMVIFGALNTIFLNLQNEYKEKILNLPFQHPWFQSIIMFIGEFYCALMWICFKHKFLAAESEEEKEETKDLPEASPFLFIISMGSDLVGSTLLNFALLNMPSSIFQMLRGGIIVITCIYMILFLKKYPKNYQWLGVGFVFVGIFLVGLSSMLYKDNGKKSANPFGIIMLLVSLLFQGFQFVFQEKILSKYKCHPMQLVAWEGTWGFLAFLIILPIFEFIPLSAGFKDLGSPSPNIKDKYYLEQTIFAFKQMFNTLPVFFFCFFQTFSICGFNFFGIMLTKLSSSATRSVMDSTRTIIVWLFFMLVPVPRDNPKDRYLESFIWLQLVGFIILVFGQLVYNGIIKIPILGFDKHFKNSETDEKENKLITQEGSENNKA